MFNNNHVGRPSNDELKQKRNMKVLLYSAPILVIAFVAIASYIVFDKLD